MEKKSGFRLGEETLHQEIGLKREKETVGVLHVEHSFAWCCDLDTSESGSEIPGKF